MTYRSTLLLSAFFLLIAARGTAQIQIQNGNMEQWNGFNLQRPDYWSSMEQATDIHANKFLWKESHPENVHSGMLSVKLLSDTSAASPTGLAPGMIAYGRAAYVRGRLVTSGLPVHGRPVSLSFYIKIYHPVRDTASVRLLLTRWNPTRRIADTLAYERRDIYPDSVAMEHFALFVDSINYLMAGEADTARVVIYGGRRGGPALRGNTAWIDDIAFNYEGNVITAAGEPDVVFLTPNPVSNILKITAGQSFLGCKVILMDVTGIKVREMTIDALVTPLDLTDLPVGSYVYALLDRDQKQIQDGNINIER